MRCIFFFSYKVSRGCKTKSERPPNLVKRRDVFSPKEQKYKKAHPQIDLRPVSEDYRCVWRTYFGFSFLFFLSHSNLALLWLFSGDDFLQSHRAIRRGVPRPAGRSCWENFWENKVCSDSSFRYILPLFILFFFCSVSLCARWTTQSPPRAKHSPLEMLMPRAGRVEKNDPSRDRFE